MVKSCLLFLFLGEGPGNLLELSDCETTELGDKDKRVTLYISSRVMFDLISQAFNMRINRDEEKPIIDLLFNAIIPIQPNARPLTQKYSHHNVFQTTFHLDPKLFFKDKCLEIKIHNFDSEDFKTFINYNASYISLNYSKTKSLDITELEPSCSETSATMFLQNDRSLTANFEARCSGSEDLRCIKKCYQSLVRATNNNKMIEKHLTFVNDGFFGTKTSKCVSSCDQKNLLQSISKPTTSSNLTIDEFYQISALVKPGSDFINGSEFISTVQNGNGEKFIFTDEATSKTHTSSTDFFSDQNDKGKEILLYDGDYHLKDKRLVNSNLHENKCLYHEIKPIVSTKNFIKSSPKPVQSGNIAMQKLFQDKQPKQLKEKSVLLKSGRLKVINLSKPFILECYLKEKCDGEKKAVHLRRRLTSESKENVNIKNATDLSIISKPGCTINAKNREIKSRKRKYEEINKTSPISRCTNNSNWKFTYNQKRISKRSVCFFGSKTTTKNFSFSFTTKTNKLNTNTIQHIHKHKSVSDLKIKDNFGIEKNVLRTKAKNLFNSSTSIKIYTNTKNQDLDKEKSFDHKFEEYKQCNTEPIALVDKHEKHNVESDKSNRWKIISVQNVPFSPISLKPLNNKSAKAISFAYRDYSARSSTFVDELTSCTYFSTQSHLNNSKSSTECALSKIAERGM